jgi:hypothetical protein
MMRATIVGSALATVLVLLALAACGRDIEEEVDPAPAMTPSTADAHEGLLYGRVTTDDGDIYEGRLRFGGDEEGLWGNYFNGFKDENPWAAHVPHEQLPKERVSIGAFGIEIGGWDRRLDLGRPFMAPFGDIVRIDARGRDLRVTLKSGTVFHLDRYAADDFADGVRVWDDRRGVVNLDEWRIRTIEFLPAALRGAAPYPLHGTVRTRHGDFTGLVQWDREACLGSDALNGHTADGEVSLRFDAIRSIARLSREGASVTLLDGREIVLSDTRQAGRGNRGIYVDDPRYGRVLVSWEAFERIDFTPGGTGPAYGDFPPGRPLRGSVTTWFGHRLAGRLVYDLDESETTETLDAPSQGVDYTIPFSLIASIVLAGPEAGGAQLARVSLHGGEELQLERSGDLGRQNAGMLIFVDGRQRPEYVPWTDITQVDFDPPPVM